MVDLNSFQNNFNNTLWESVLSIKEEHDHIIFEILPNAIIDIVTHLKSKKGFSFTTLIDITAIDFPAREKRFDMVYHFLSMTENKRCKIRSFGEAVIIPNNTVKNKPQQNENHHAGPVEAGFCRCFESTQRNMTSIFLLTCSSVCSRLGIIL